MPISNPAGGNPSKWVQIGSTTVTGAVAASVTFASIPAGFKEFKLVCKVLTDGAGDQAVTMRYNADAGANYYPIYIKAAGAAVTSAVSAGTNYFWLCYNQSNAIWGHVTANMSNDNALGRKTLDCTSYGNVVGVYGGYWNSTNEITDITVMLSGDNYAVGSCFTLWGSV